MGRSASPTASEAKDSPVANTDFARDHFWSELEVADGVRLPDELRANVPDRFFRYRGTNPQNNDRFEALVESPFLVTDKSPLSTFSIDVDTASYSKIRQYLSQSGAVPSPNMVRIEEMINYFEYDYEGPKDDTPIASHMAIDRCPWNPEHQLVRIGLQAKKVAASARPKANIVFLLDVSGSMNQPNRLPLVKKSLSLLANQLTENDRVAIVVYAGAAGCVLPSIAGSEKQAILSSLEHLNAGGSTNGGQGIQLAYSIAKENFVQGGINRVILCTDGDFNVGVTGDQALVEMMQQNAKSNVFLTCLGFGMGNYNDTMMEKISNQGNGVYGMIDNEIEARRMMVEQLSGTLVTVAKDVKIQVDFNPKKIASYRLIGYDDRRLANQDFANDAKDAGEIGAGHRVTALYEIVPVGNSETPAASSETSKYQAASQPASAAPVVQGNDAFSDELLTLKVRYKEPEGSTSVMKEFVLKDAGKDDRPAADLDMQWAEAVAEFGLLLRQSKMAPNADWGRMIERAEQSTVGNAYRLECVALMRKAAETHRNR
jgi:Ca-activated chloride channel family protein